jgi:hypothetical protein
MQVDMNTKIKLQEWNSISAAQWQALAQKKIFFAHMSVGYNIISGVDVILRKHPDISLNIMDISNLDNISQFGLYHAELGHNTEPFLKIDSFCSQLNRIGSTAPDIAFLKFCYVDIVSDTDVKALFNAYQKAICDQKTKTPNTLFLHCTVPLESTPLSVKGKCKEIAKAILGRSVSTDNNYKRMQFNEMLKNRWPAEQILDIAQMESTTPEGILRCKIRHGQKIPFLYEKYTTDGGHLNDAGSQCIGQQFLIFLANSTSLLQQQH